MKQYIVVAYDISNNKRRNKICDILSGYGKRANYSVFECFLGKKDIEQMKEKIEQVVKKGKDIVLYYFLCNNCIEKNRKVESVFRGTICSKNHLIPVEDLRKLICNSINDLCNKVLKWI